MLNLAPNMPAKKTTKTPNKSAFIRSQPASLSGPEVVAKGKAAGIKFSSQLVYNVRGGGSKAKRGAAKKTPTAKSSAAVAPKAASAKSKADFVRAHADLSPKEIVAAAKAAGLKLGVSYVYNVRGYDKSKTKKKRATRATAVRRAPAVRRPITTGSKAETLLRAVAAEIGLGRAMEILSAERAMVRAVIGG